MPNEIDAQTNDPAASPLPGPPSPPGPLGHPNAGGGAAEVDPKKPAAAPKPSGGAGSCRSEFASRTNAYLLDYIKFADAKAGAILTFAGVVGGGIASTAAKTLADARTVAAGIELGAAVVIGAVLVLAIGVAMFCLRALAPNTPGAASLTSFPDIARMPLDQYVGSVAGLTTDEAAAREYANHNWTLSRVAQSKFDAIKAATRWLRWMIFAGAAYGFAVVVIGTLPRSCVISL